MPSRKLLFLTVLTVAGASSSSVALGAITIYTDRPSFEAAAGSLTLEDFNAFPETLPYYFTENVGVGFNGFTVTATALNAHGVAIGDNQGWSGNVGFSNIDGTPHLAWGRIPSGTGNTGPAIEILFDAPITAIGFDWKDTDTSDAYTLSIPDLSLSYGNVSPWPTGAGGGFFGLISDDTAFLSLTLVSGPAKGGVVTPMGLDNLVHNVPAAVSVGDIPEPTSVAIWSLVGLAFFAFGFRRPGRRNA